MISDRPAQQGAHFCPTLFRFLEPPLRARDALDQDFLNHSLHEVLSEPLEGTPLGALLASAAVQQTLV
jgi:hypothetical protein